MKAITLLVTLALISFAFADDFTDSTSISKTYAWWFNLGTVGVAIGIYSQCLYTGWIASFFSNDGGAGFYECLYENGTNSNWGALEATA